MKERKDKQPTWLENRPNRNVASLESFGENGYEVGDNGSFVKELDNQLDVDLFLDRLTGRQKQIITLLYKGFMVKEIANKLKITTRAVNRTIERVKKNVPF